MDFKRKFGQRLKELRKKQKLSQEKLAELVNVDPKHISFIETARSFPSADLIERLSAALNVDDSDLFSFRHKQSKKELLKDLSKRLESFDEDKLELIYKIALEL